MDYDTTKGRKKYNYAPLNEVIEATKEALSTYGLSVIQTTYLTNSDTILETILCHSSGEWVSGELYVGKQDVPPQTEGSALTYKRRYGMSAILRVSSEDDDDGEEGGVVKKTEQTVKKDEPVDKSNHWCETHQAKFFKTANMRSYGHPIGDTKEWCHEHTKPPPQPPEPTTEVNVEGSDRQPTTRDLTALRTTTDMIKAVHKDFGIQPKDQLVEFNIRSWSDLILTPIEAYQAIASVHQVEE